MVTNSKDRLLGVFDLESLIRDAVATFGRGELAYLALTGKPELHVRDRVAFRMHADVETSSRPWRISREWGPRRIDLAVLDATPKSAGTLLAAIEFKWWYTFDAMLGRKLKSLRQVMQNDIEKCRNEATDARCILAFTHPLTESPRVPRGLVKYSSGIRAGLKTAGSAEALAGECRTMMRDKFAKYAPAELKVPRPVGEAFGIGVEVLWFMLSPFAAPG